jgi:hypothetical protein
MGNELNELIEGRESQRIKRKVSCLAREEEKNIG